MCLRIPARMCLSFSSTTPNRPIKLFLSTHQNSAKNTRRATTKRNVSALKRLTKSSTLSAIAKLKTDSLSAFSYDEIKEKGYSLSAGQYFDIKIDYVDITEEEFNHRMADYEAKLTEMFAESHRLESEILKQLKSLRFNGNS